MCRHDLQVLSLVARQVDPAEVPASVRLVLERLELGAQEQAPAGITVEARHVSELVKWVKARVPAAD